MNPHNSIEEKKKKRKKKAKWPDYSIVDTGDIATFGTTIYIREDNAALRIVFPAGNVLTFCPLEDIELGDKLLPTTN